MTANTVTKKQSKELEQFLLNDKDGSGTVTAQEIIDFLESAGCSLTEPQKQEQRDWVKAVDTNGDGAVSVEEFRAMLENAEVIDSTAELFKMFDKDDSGFISKDEIKQVMKATMGGHELTEEEVDKMMAEYDTNGDGKISYEEFAKSVEESAPKGEEGE